MLGLEPDRPALRLDRLYLIDGRPVALAQAWLVPEVGTLARATAKLMATEDMMRQVGIVIASSEVTMRAEAAGAVVGRALQYLRARTRLGFAPQDPRRRRHGQGSGPRVVLLGRLRVRLLHRAPGRCGGPVRHSQRCREGLSVRASRSCGHE